MAERHTAHVLIGFLAILVAGDARGQGCCTKNDLSQCSDSASSAACSASGGIAYIQGATCTFSGCTPAVTAVLESDPMLTVNDHAASSMTRRQPRSDLSFGLLQGFDNVTFEFFGRPELNYSIMSSTAFSVNMRLIEASPLHIHRQEGEGEFPRSVRLL